MSLRKSTTLTPALLPSNRHNARRSTGPRTDRRKAPSRLNGLKEGGYSPIFRKLLPECPARCGVRDGSGHFDSGASSPFPIWPAIATQSLGGCRPNLRRNAGFQPAQEPPRRRRYIQIRTALLGGNRLVWG